MDTMRDSDSIETTEWIDSLRAVVHCGARSGACGLPQP
jgi:hypothetical protein